MILVLMTVLFNLVLLFCVYKVGYYSGQEDEKLEASRLREKYRD